MAKRTIEFGSCLNDKPHSEHKFRPGIFGLGRKVLCKGVREFVLHNWDTPEELYLKNYCETDVELCTILYKETFPPHRHNYEFMPEKSDKIIMTWQCLDPFCKEEYSRFRSLFNFQTRNAKELSFQYWLWR